MAALRPDAATAVVALTHDPKLDDPALAAALRSKAFYVAALGSRKNAAARRERLRAMGIRGCRTGPCARAGRAGDRGGKSGGDRAERSGRDGGGAPGRRACGSRPLSRRTLWERCSRIR
jgi:hypothetical protein